jgi:endoglucanase
MAPSKMNALGFLFFSLALSRASASEMLRSTQEGAVSIDGAHFLRDKHIWVAQGVTVLALVAPDISTRDPDLEAAKKSYGPEELDRVRAFGADVIRFQISEPGLDKESPLYTSNYKERIGTAVMLARRAGFTVILSLQWQSPSGLKGLPGMPGTSAYRAWREILPVVVNDPGVMLELFNEPAAPNPTGFPEWARGFQALIDHLRSLGAGNVILVDGIGYARFLPTDTPRLYDPIGQLGYAIHPYILGQYKTEPNWEAAFGKFSDSHPVIATEWNATSDLKFCQPDYPETARLLVHYLKKKRIGLVGWAFDYPDTIFKDNSEILTDFERFSCRREVRGGAGQLLREVFELDLH